MSSDLDYTRTLLLVLTNAYKPELIKRYKKLFDYATGETRGDYQNAAYKQHKHVIQPLVFSNCFKKEQYENQEDLDLAIQNFDKDPDYIKMEYEGVTLYESRQKPYFAIFYERAIYTDYYSEDENGGEAEYQSDSDGPYGPYYCEEDDEEDHDD
jgi:hypothetical protein